MAEKKLEAHVPKAKIEAVQRMAEDMKNANCIVILSIKSLPSAQFQKIKKDFRDKASIRVAKKSIINRAIDATGIKELEGLKNHVQEDSAVLISNEDPFQLSGMLAENRSAVFAKAGQIAEEDISVEEGPTDLVPGPVISELGSLGLQIMVEEGKITIRKSKVVVKKGEKVSSNASSIFQKLGIKPFMIGINPAAAYDAKSRKVFTEIKIDKKKKLEELLIAQSKALGFAINIAYPSKETIGMLLAKANSHANALNKLAPASA